MKTRGPPPPHGIDPVVNAHHEVVVELGISDLLFFTNSDTIVQLLYNKRMVADKYDNTLAILVFIIS